MKNRFKSILLSGVIAVAASTQAFALDPRDHRYTPPPPKPAAATATYDYHAIDLLKYISQWGFAEYLRWHSLQPKVENGIIDVQKIANNTSITQNELKNNTNLRLQTIQTDIKRVFDSTQKAEINIGKILNELTKYFNKPTGVVAAFSGKNKPIPYYDNAIDKAVREPVPNFDTLSNDLRTKTNPPPTPFTASMSQAINRYKLQDTIKTPAPTGPASLYETREPRSHVASAAVTASAVSENAFKQSSKSMERINTYIQAIKDSEDIKTSVDLNTRVMLEIVQQNNELLRTIAAMNSVNANYMMFNLGGK